MRFEVVDHCQVSSLIHFHIHCAAEREVVKNRISEIIVQCNGAIEPPEHLDHQCDQTNLAVDNGVECIRIEHIDSESDAIVFRLEFIITYSIPPQPRNPVELNWPILPPPRGITARIITGSIN